MTRLTKTIKTDIKGIIRDKAIKPKELALEAKKREFLLKAFWGQISKYDYQAWKTLPGAMYKAATQTTHYITVRDNALGDISTTFDKEIPHPHAMGRWLSYVELPKHLQHEFKELIKEVKDHDAYVAEVMTNLDVTLDSCTTVKKLRELWVNGAEIIDKANIGARMYEYCTKDDTRISAGSLVLGDPPKRVDNKQNGARGRQLQTERYATAIDLAKKGQFDDIDPELYLKHHTTLKRIHVESKRTELLPFPYPLRHWQHYVTGAISKPDDRKVTWVYDSDGGSGKSTFAKWLAASPETFYIDGGKKEEILFLIKEDIKTLLIDIPRSGKDFVPYGLMETFKNGIWTTNKYEGNRVIRKEPGAVVVLANFRPDITKLSKDRWDIIEVSQDKSYFKNIKYYDVPENL